MIYSKFNLKYLGKMRALINFLMRLTNKESNWLHQVSFETVPYELWVLFLKLNSTTTLTFAAFKKKFLIHSESGVSKYNLPVHEHRAIRMQINSMRMKALFCLCLPLVYMRIETFIRSTQLDLLIYEFWLAMFQLLSEQI